MSSLGQGVNINESMKLQKALQKYEEIKVSSLDSFIDPVWNPVVSRSSHSDNFLVWKLHPFFGCVFCFLPDAADSCS